jgi:hypothetical protein
MPAKEIKALRQEGKLQEALTLAKEELQAEPDNIWSKRNISWVYYEYLKQNSTKEYFDSFILWIKEIEKLNLPEDEEVFFKQLCWIIGKFAFILLKEEPMDVQKSFRLFDAIRPFPFPKPSEGYSFLFKALHKLLKGSDHYLQFADWWEFKNFRNEDFQKEKLPNGKEIMSIAEQAYIACAGHLLPKHTQDGGLVFDRQKAEAFLPVLSAIVEDYPQFQYPPYFHAKLLLALGSRENMLNLLLPFAKKKRNDFWVWEILAEAFSDDSEKVFACYCRALYCKSPEEMLVNLRQKMAGLLIAKSLYDEAKTEIDLLVTTRSEQGYRIPNEVINWKNTVWYKNAKSAKSNHDFYKSYAPFADALLFSDIKEELIFVEFVNTDKKVLNFIASETKYGFLKYDRFFARVAVGDVLSVRFQGGSNEGMHQLYTAIKVNNEAFKGHFMKDVSGIVKIPAGKPFGFLDDAFIHPSIVAKFKLTDGMQFSGKAIKSFNQEKKRLSWKLV